MTRDHTNESLGLHAVVAACAAASVLLVPLTTHAGIFGPDNFSECVLSRMPGAANDIVAQEIVVQCTKEFPGNMPIKKQTGIFAAFDSGGECTLKKAKDTPSAWAANLIRAYCYGLYEPVNPYADPNFGK